jgi:hypothetical protein
MSDRGSWAVLSRILLSTLLGELGTKKSSDG